MENEFFIAKLREAREQRHYQKASMLVELIRLNKLTDKFHLLAGEKEQYKIGNQLAACRDRIQNAIEAR